MENKNTWGTGIQEEKEYREYRNKRKTWRTGIQEEQEFRGNRENR